MARTSKTKEKFVIIGAGGAGREMFFHLQAFNSVRQEMGLPPYECIGFLDDNINALDCFDGFPPILGVIDEDAVPENVSLVLAIGFPQTRLRIVNRLKKYIHRFPTIDLRGLADNIVTNGQRGIHCGYGNFIHYGVRLSTNIKMGDFNYFNGTNITISHDDVIGDHCVLCANVFLAGGVSLGNGVYIGPGGVVSLQRSVGAWSQISANSTVMKNVPPCSLVLGVPGKIHKDFFETPSYSE